MHVVAFKMQCNLLVFLCQQFLETVKMAEANTDFVMGFITQRKLSSNPDLIHFTPGKDLLII